MLQSIPLVPAILIIILAPVISLDDEEETRMTHKIARSISAWALRHNKDLTRKASIIVYGIEAMLSSLIGVSLIILVSMILRHCLLWIPFMIGFVPLRLFGGGYHASSHARCYMVITLAFSIAAIISIRFPFSVWGDIGLTVISCILIITLSPVPLELR